MELASLTPGLVGRDTAERLATLAGEVPSHQAIVEVGVFMARTTTFLAAGARAGNGAHVYGVDPWDLPGDRYPFKWVNHPNRSRRRIRQMFTKPSTREGAEALIQNHGLALDVTLIQGFSVDVAADWGGPEVGFLLIDGDHREEFVRADWEAWRVHLAEDALVVWDDYHRDYPGVVAVVDGLVDAGSLFVDHVIERRNSALAVTRA